MYPPVSSMHYPAPFGPPTHAPTRHLTSSPFLRFPARLHRKAPARNQMIPRSSSITMPATSSNHHAAQPPTAVTAIRRRGLTSPGLGKKLSTSLTHLTPSRPAPQLAPRRHVVAGCFRGCWHQLRRPPLRRRGERGSVWWVLLSDDMYVRQRWGTSFQGILLFCLCFDHVPSSTSQTSRPQPLAGAFRRFRTAGKLLWGLSITPSTQPACSGS